MEVQRRKAMTEIPSGLVMQKHLANIFKMLGPQVNESDPVQARNQLSFQVVLGHKPENSVSRDMVMRGHL